MAKQQHLLKLGSLIPENADTGPEWSVECGASGKVTCSTARGGRCLLRTLFRIGKPGEEERRGGLRPVHSGNGDI